MKNYLKKTIVVCALFLVVLTGCFGKEREEVILTDKPADSEVNDVPTGWVKDTTELFERLGTVTYIVPEYFKLSPTAKWKIDRYYKVDGKLVCNLRITGKFDVGGGPITENPIHIDVPPNAPYRLSVSDKWLIAATFENGLEFWMQMSNPEYAEQCGKDFVGFLNSIEYTPAK